MRSVLKLCGILALSGALLAPAGAAASTVRFDDNWKEQRFSFFSSNDFGLEGDTLSVRSDGTVSLLWTKLDARLWQTRTARWEWRVRAGVPATDLTQKGGDDRNLSLYFVFLPPDIARRAKDSDILELMDQPKARVLMYVWGGAHAAGDILPTPYLGERGRTIIRHPAGTGERRESIDLAADHLAAFGEPAGSLVGLAVSADSDDTDTWIDASIRALRLLP